MDHPYIYIYIYIYIYRERERERESNLASINLNEATIIINILFHLIGRLRLGNFSLISSGQILVNKVPDVDGCSCPGL